MEIKTCKTCGKEFLSSENRSYYRICSKVWYADREKHRKETDARRWREENERNEKKMKLSDGIVQLSKRIQ